MQLPCRKTGAAVFTLLAAILAAACLAPAPAVLAVTAQPDARFEFTQPDGKKITLELIGDERTGRYATTDGYTAVQAPNGYWEYAVKDAEGELQPSGTPIAPPRQRSSSEQSFLQTLDRYLAPTSLRMNEGPSPYYEPVLAISPDRDAKLSANALVILIEFPDYGNTYPQSDFDDLMGQSGFDGIGSVNDYYEEVSYGAFGINATTTVWYTAANNRSYYGWISSTNPNWNAQAELAREAIQAAITAGVNFAPFDNDSDGYVDGLFIVHAGPGAEVMGSGWPWSHKWSLYWGTGSTLTASGKTIDDYCLQPEKYNSTERVRIGVYCHEFGHMLGLPDLYDIDGSSIGIGRWGLMGSGSWNDPSNRGASPAHFCAWSKKELNWLTPSNVTSDLFGWTVDPVETSPTAYRLWTAGATGNEYFLAEYRQQTLFDTYLPGCGMAIWHVDDSKSDNSADTDRLVDLEEADNTENNSVGDVWLANTFNDVSTPNSNAKAGTLTQVEIGTISGTCDPSLLADLRVGVNPPPVEIMIRDCENDIGSEPDVECASICKSPDIYIDNDLDGIIDPPAPGLVNMIYFIARNIGANSVAGATLNAYFVDPALGLHFPGSATPIADDYTAATTFTYPTIFPGSNERVFINWLIPAPPPAIDHYCIGAVLNVVGDMQVSEYPREDNNVAQINMWALYQKAGQVAPCPNRLNDFTPKSQDSTTVFHSIIKGCNPLGGATYFETRFSQASLDSLPPGWQIAIENPGPHLLWPDSCIDIHVYLYAFEPRHNDSALVELQFYPTANPELVVGAGALAYCIDSYEAEPVSTLSAEINNCPPDYLDPCPQVILNFPRPNQDITGARERIRWFYIYCDSLPDTWPPTVYDSLAYDLDPSPSRPGFQWYDYRTLQDGEERYYRVASVDGSFSPSEPGNTVKVSLSCCTLRGDYNSDGTIAVSDLTALIAYLFRGGPPPACLEHGDCNADGSIKVSDLTLLIAYLFRGGPPPAPC